MLLELNVLEANQVLAALEDRLHKANDATASLEEGSLEESMVAAEILYTGRVYTRLQEVVYGPDEPDEPEWTNREGQPEFNGAFR